MQSSASRGKALYYPYISIADVNWLKMSLLYWDGLRRISPESLTPEDAKDVKQVVDAGLLESISPKSYRGRAGKLFTERLVPVIENMVDDAPESIASMVDRSLHTLYSVPISSEELHVEKLDWKVRQQLQGLNLAEERDEWVTMHPILGGFYMTCLATAISEKVGSPIFTDVSEYQACEEHLCLSQNPAFSRQDFHSTLLQLDIDLPAPQALQHVPISKILQFHSQRKDERRRFRKAIESITEEAKTLDDPIALNDFFSDQREEIQASLRDYRQTWKDLDTRYSASLIRACIPIGIAASVNLVANHPLPLATEIGAVFAAVGITASTVEWSVDRRIKQRETAQKNPWQYVLPLKQFVSGGQVT